jgi:threonine/homoserine efflux transporter RhtA
VSLSVDVSVVLAAVVAVPVTVVGSDVAVVEPEVVVLGSDVAVLGPAVVDASVDVPVVELLPSVAEVASVVPSVTLAPPSSLEHAIRVTAAIATTWNE